MVVVAAYLVLQIGTALGSRHRLIEYEVDVRGVLFICRWELFCLVVIACLKTTHTA